jgi:hypothetical protein
VTIVGAVQMAVVQVVDVPVVLDGQVTAVGAVDVIVFRVGRVVHHCLLGPRDAQAPRRDRRRNATASRT